MTRQLIGSAIALLLSVAWVAPAGTPKPVIDKWNRELGRILRLPDIAQRLTKLGSEGVGNSPAEFAKFVKAESAKYAKAIKGSGTRVD